MRPKSLERALLERIESEIAKREKRAALMRYTPYPKQAAFHAAGATHRERLLMAGNQLGKTIAGAAELAMHLTGLYPDWWQGRRYDRPIRAWAASVTNEATRSNVQAKLIGPPEQPEEYGTGMVPHASLMRVKPAIGTPYLLDSAIVKHSSGGNSTIEFKSYSQGREKWQGPSIDVVWFDEEPPIDIYMEGLTRTNAKPEGIVYLTFTPLLGLSEVVRLFINPDTERS